MITIVCPQCQKKYTFDESMIPADLQLIECKICGTQFPLDIETDDPLDLTAPLPDSADEGTYEESKVVFMSAFSSRKLPFRSEQQDLKVDPFEQPLVDGKSSICLLSLSPEQLDSESNEDESCIELTETDTLEERNALSPLDFSTDESATESDSVHADLDAAPIENEHVEEMERSAQFAFSAERYRSLNAHRRNSERRFLFYSFLLIVCLMLIAYFIYAGLL